MHQNWALRGKNDPSRGPIPKPKAHSLDHRFGHLSSKFQISRVTVSGGKPWVKGQKIHKNWTVRGKMTLPVVRYQNREHTAWVTPLGTFPQNFRTLWS